MPSLPAEFEKRLARPFSEHERSKLFPQILYLGLQVLDLLLLGVELRVAAEPFRDRRGIIVFLVQGKLALKKI